MTEERTAIRKDRLDDAIDRTVRTLTRQDAPATLRARVMTRLSEGASAERRRLRSSRFGAPGSAWTPRRLAWAGAAAAVFIAASLFLPRWRTNTDVSPSGTVAGDARSVRPAAASAEPASPPHVVVKPAPPDRTTTARAQLTRVSRERELPAAAERPPFIDRLRPPERIAIAPIETEWIVTESVEVEPVARDALNIEPIHIQR